MDSATVNGSLQYTAAGKITGGTLSLSDAADAASVTVTYTTSTQSLSGTVSQSGKPLATFTTNLAGTGTVTYSNGTTGTITNWTVQS